MFYANKLSEQQQEFCKEIYAGLKARKTNIKAPDGMEKDPFIECIKTVQYDYPEIFYVNFKYLSYLKYPDYYEYTPKYMYSYEETSKRQTLIKNKVNEILQKLNAANMHSVYQKCGWLHNYIVNHCVYDDEAVKNPDENRTAYNIEGVLLKNTAVCQGIALAYRYLCSFLGIEAIVARGVSLQPGSTTYERHAWNIICAGESAAHIDVTWDMNLSESQKRVRYDYFFLPDIEAMRDHQYVGYPICRQLKSSYFERAGTQFHDSRELAVYVEQKAKDSKADCLQKPLYLCFKMKNKKETREEINTCVIEAVRNVVHTGFSYTYSMNQAQSVFEYLIEFK